MAKQPFISHSVNGYSRYDLPESKAFTCTPGIAYPVRIDFINPRDRVTIEQGVDVRTNPLAVPTFNPYIIRLHRFWVPMQLYHAEMRTNSSKFDMNDVTLNWIPAQSSSSFTEFYTGYPNSLLSWLRVTNRGIYQSTDGPLSGVELSASSSINDWVNADTYLAYWDVVRNYYSYSQWGCYSFAWPANWAYLKAENQEVAGTFSYPTDYTGYFNQRFGNLEFLDAFYESQFYPSSVLSSNRTFNRFNLFRQILSSDLDRPGAASSDGYPVLLNPDDYIPLPDDRPLTQLSTSNGSDSTERTEADLFLFAHPLAVVPSSPDRFSRLLPNGSADAVSMTGVTTIPQLAIASRLQEYKDLLGAGGNRFSDWLETFFASKIEHVDRPKLLFAASQTVNAQIVLNQTGSNGSGSTLGDQGGTIAFNDRLGRRQSYYFSEPGYLLDILSIRPVYYWSGIRPDYLNYQGSDYFNPIYNDIGYQDVPNTRFYSLGSSASVSLYQEPCFNEFRSSFDEALGMLSSTMNLNSDSPSLYTFWLQQRNRSSFEGSSLALSDPIRIMFTDLSSVNSPFASNVEDNFIVNLSYSVRKKNLVNKSFATRLSNR